MQRGEYFGVVQLDPKTGRLREQLHLMSQMWERKDRSRVLGGHPQHCNPGNYPFGLIKKMAGVGKGEDEGFCPSVQAERALSNRDVPCRPHCMARSGERPRVLLEGGSCPTGRTAPGTGTHGALSRVFTSATQTDSWFRIIE